MDHEINIWLNNNPHRDRHQAKAYSDAILQQLLKDTLNCSADLTMHKNQNGKPYVKEPVYFSHSNSRQLYAYVVTTAGEVAIDVEWQRPDHAYLKLSQRYFTAAEQQYISSGHPDTQADRFYRLWTRKEAWCKLEGGNLWSYLGKAIPNTDGLYFHDLTGIRGFAACLASDQPITGCRINSLGQL